MSHSEEWNRQLTLQTFWGEREMAFLDTLDCWSSAQRIADLGCGNGQYLKMLRTRYPNKVFTGIDREQEMLSLARESLGPDVDLIHSDLLNDTVVEGDFDALFARALVQHLPSVDAFLQRTREMIDVGGIVCVIDADDESWKMSSDDQLAVDLFAVLADVQKKLGVGRDAANLVEKRSSAFGFTTVETARISFVAETATQTRLMADLLKNVLLIFQEHIDPPKRDALTSRLEDWCKTPGSSAQAATKACVLRKTSD